MLNNISDVRLTKEKYNEKKMDTILIMSLVFLLISCDSTKNFNRWSTGEINRPFTLPDRLNFWASEFSSELSTNKNSINFNVSTITIFQWNQSLSDDWELVWSPLPLSIKHQLYYNRSGYTGLELGIIPVYTSSAGLGLLPDIDFETLKKMNIVWAVKMNAGGSIFILFTEKSKNYLINIIPEIIDQIYGNQSVSIGFGCICTNFYNLGNFSIDGVTSVPGDTMNFILADIILLIRITKGFYVKIERIYSQQQWN